MKNTLLKRFRKILLITVVFAFSTIGLAWLVYHDSSEPPSLQTSTLEQLDLNAAVQMIAEQTVSGGATGVILSIEKAGVSYTATAGFANKATGQTMPSDLPIRIGSVSKVYTAAVILFLAQQGLIDLDSKISRYLPSDIISGLANADRATVRQLLMHTGGIPDYYSVSSYFLSDWTQPINLARTLPVARGKSAQFRAGEQFEYSNMGYILLGEIAEHVSGESFANLLDNVIYQPLGLSDTYYNIMHPVDDGVHGYGTILRPWADTYQWWEHSGPDGGLMATPSDVITFLKALTDHDGKLKSIGDLMLETLVPGEARQLQGMGLLKLVSKSGANLVGHTGDVFGYQTAAFSAPDLDAVFVGHVNCDCGVLSVSLIKNAYKAIVSSKALPERLGVTD